MQQPPVLLDREATLAAAVRHLHAAADAGARLVVFPETYIPGYPAWIWRLKPGDDYELTGEIHRVLLENSIDLAADGLRLLRDAARERSLVVVCGVHERDGEFGRSTIYNTVVTIGADGEIANRHRKLVPTNPERMVWGQGDATGLRVTQTAVGRVGTLICWENYMPLPRYALYSEGVEVYVASTWDEGEMWIASMRHIAAEGRCWVISSGCSLRASDVPAAFPQRDQVFPDPDEWINPGELGHHRARGRHRRRAAARGARHPDGGHRSGASRCGAENARCHRPLRPSRHLPVDRRPQPSRPGVVPGLTFPAWAPSSSRSG